MATNKQIVESVNTLCDVVDAMLTYVRPNMQADYHRAVRDARLVHEYLEESWGSCAFEVMTVDELIHKIRKRFEIIRRRSFSGGRLNAHIDIVRPIIEQLVRDREALQDVIVIRDKITRGFKERAERAGADVKRLEEERDAKDAALRCAYRYNDEDKAKIAKMEAERDEMEECVAVLREWKYHMDNGTIAGIWAEKRYTALAKYDATQEEKCQTKE